MVAPCIDFFKRLVSALVPAVHMICCLSLGIVLLADPFFEVKSLLSVPYGVFRCDYLPSVFVL